MTVGFSEIKSEKDLLKYKDLWKKIEKNPEMTVFQSYEWNVLLYRQWKKPIDNLETIIEMSHECAEMYCESFIEEAEKEEVNSICSNIKKNPEEFLETYFELKK